jgi:hypothetical protein
MTMICQGYWVFVTVGETFVVRAREQPFFDEWHGGDPAPYVSFRPPFHRYSKPKEPANYSLFNASKREASGSYRPIKD